MANGYYRDVIIDNYGRPLTGVTITVYLTGTLNLATLYSNRAGSLALANPFTNESGDGSFEFWADTTERYDIVFSKSGITFDNTDYTDVDVGFLPDGAIDTAKLADGAVTTVKIADSQITDAKVISITTRAKLPSQLAYEDEANTFTSDQTIAKSTALLTINDTSGTAEGRLKLARSGTGRTLRDNGTEFQIVNAAFSATIVGIDNTGKMTTGIVPLARMGVSGTHTTASLGANLTEGFTITHGLGTDNVKILIMAVGDSVLDEWVVGARRPDGALVAVSGNGSVATSAAPSLPSTGDVRFLVRNGPTGSQAITVKYSILRED